MDATHRYVHRKLVRGIHGLHHPNVVSGTLYLVLPNHLSRIVSIEAKHWGGKGGRGRQEAVRVAGLDEFLVSLCISLYFALLEAWEERPISWRGTS